MTMEKVYNASPFIQRLKAESQREGKRENSSQLILRRLTKRFGDVSSDLPARLAAVTDEAKLLDLVDVAFECDTLDQFLSAMPSMHPD